MRFIVGWSPEAENELAAIWMSADDRDAVRAAADEIDLRLSRDAHRHGESREGIIRIDFAGPLGVEFEVYMDDLRVYVIGIWRYDTHD